MPDYDVPLIGAVETKYYTPEDTLTYELPLGTLPGDFLMVIGSHGSNGHGKIIDPTWTRESFGGIRELGGSIYYRFLGEGEGSSVSLQFEPGSSNCGLLTVWRNVDPEEPIHSELPWLHGGVEGEVQHELHKLNSVYELTRPCKVIYMRSVYHSPHPRLGLWGGGDTSYLGAWGMTVVRSWFTYGMAVHRNGVTSDPGGGEPPVAPSGDDWRFFNEMSSMCATIALSALPVAE